MSFIFFYYYYYYYYYYVKDYNIVNLKEEKKERESMKSIEKKFHLKLKSVLQVNCIKKKERKNVIVFFFSHSNQELIDLLVVVD